MVTFVFWPTLSYQQGSCYVWSAEGTLCPASLFYTCHTGSKVGQTHRTSSSTSAWYLQQGDASQISMLTLNMLNCFKDYEICTVEPLWKGQECLTKFGPFPCTILYKSCLFYPSWQATSFERPPLEELHCIHISYHILDSVHQNKIKFTME